MCCLIGLVCRSDSDAGWAVCTVRAGASPGTRASPGTEEASDKQVLTGLTSQSSAHPTLREGGCGGEGQGSTHMGRGT